jgi:TolB-like protein
LTTAAAPAAEPEINPRRDSIDPVAASSSPATIKKKNIRALAMFSTVAVMAIAALLLQYRRSAIHQPMPAVRSVAVLPLKNLSGDPTQEYFSDGMTESIIARLSTIRGLRVISRTSVMRFKDTKLAVSEIAQTLQVDAIVEGSVIREGDRIRVRAQLIRAASDDHFWSETYDRELRDVLALESEVAQSIAEKVEASVTREEHSRLVASRPVAPEVYESFLKGAFTGDYSRAGLKEVSPISRMRSEGTRHLRRRTWAWQTRILSTAHRASAARLRIEYGPK